MMIQKNIAQIHDDYNKHELNESDVDANPFVQFSKWLQQALESEGNYATAMTLATANGSKPSARIVLLKEVNDTGFQFFTNYESRKGSEISLNQNVALLFFWQNLERQVRVEGKVVKLSSVDSDHYFYSRPQESQINAIISKQSNEIRNRDELTRLKDDFIRMESPIRRPDSWGGYVVIPQYIEFWQGRSGRLHDRIVYKKNGDIWEIIRLAP